MVAKCDHLDKHENEPSQRDIEKLIITIRGEQVLIDSDLAMIYEVETKNLKRAVRANIERFPKDFMFVLTKEEYNSLRCKNFTLKNGRGQHSKYLPYAFTQTGVAMLSGLLRSKIAVDANIRIMRAFVNMRRFISANAQIFQRLDNVEQKQLENKIWMEQTDNKIEQILNTIEERSPKLLPEQIFGTGCVWDAVRTITP